MGTDAETANEGCSIGLLSLFVHASEGHLRTNQENARQISPEANLMETIP